jgi:transcriptional regulator NrdR family protein
MIGLKCPRCSALDCVGVIDTRPIDEPSMGIRRRRICRECEHRFTTYEFFTRDGKADKTLRSALNKYLARA